MQPGIDAGEHAIGARQCSSPLRCTRGRGSEGEILSYSPLPCTRGRGVGGEGVRRQQLNPAGAGGSAVAALMAQLALEEQQFGILGTADMAGLTRAPRLGVLPQTAMTLRQQHV